MTSCLCGSASDVVTLAGPSETQNIMMAEEEEVKKYTIAICVATGTQGKALISRFKELNESPQFKAKAFHLIALTRNDKSNSALKLVEDNHSYDLPDETEVERTIVDTALESGVKHIVYASSVGCHDEDHGVPHWTASYETEEYIKRKCHQDRSSDASSSSEFLYHFIRLPHFNENFLPGSYNAPSNGQIFYPFSSEVDIPTTCARDIARTSCKILAMPNKLANGDHIDVVSEVTSVKKIAAALSETMGEKIEPVQGPWVFLTFGHCFGFEPGSIVKMGKFVESTGPTYDCEKLKEFLKEEISVEPLETVEKFVERNFSSSS